MGEILPPEDSELEDFDHEAAGERISFMMEALKSGPRVLERLSQWLRCQERTEIMATRLEICKRCDENHIKNR